MAENSMCCINWEQMNSERHLYEKKAEEIIVRSRTKWSDPWNKNIRREIYPIVYNFVHGAKTEEVYTSNGWKVTETKECCNSLSTA